MLRHSAALVALSALTVMVSAAIASTSSFPRPLRGCGSITYENKRVAVDFAEGHGRIRISCRVGRGAMRHYLFLARSRRWRNQSGRNLDFRYEGRLFQCYTSRKDGVGWDYHCGLDGGRWWVDVAAGRRGRRICALPDVRANRCPPG